ncbi:hypothetical protein FOCC_FOCC005130, partial [Frankliniella occidentalis]
MCDCRKQMRCKKVKRAACYLFCLVLYTDRRFCVFLPRRSSPGYSMGPHTLRVPMELFALNRRRLCEALRPRVPDGAVVLLQGGDEVPLYCTDVSYNEFKQEAFFQWLCGVQEVGCFVALRVSDGRCVVFVPRLPAEYAVWMGKLRTLEEFKSKYAVEETAFVDERVELRVPAGQQQQQEQQEQQEQQAGAATAGKEQQQAERSEGGTKKEG